MKNIWVRLLSLNKRKLIANKAKSKPLLLLAKIKEKRVYIKISKREKKKTIKETLKYKTLKTEVGEKFKTRYIRVIKDNKDTNKKTNGLLFFRIN